MVERPEHRHPCLGHARLRQPEQQEGVGRVAQREHQHGQQVPVEGAPEAVPVAAHVPARRRRRRAPRRLPDSRDEGCQHRHAGDRREEEHLSELEPGTHEERRSRERTHHGAGVVHGAVEAEGGAADLRGGHVGDERVAGRGADALPHPVGETQRQHRRPGAGQADERPGHRGEPVAGEEHGLAPPDPVGEDTRHQLERRGGGLGHPLDEPDHPSPRAHGGGQKQRQQRVDHLAGQVGEEAHQPERHHRRRQPLEVGRGLVHAGRDLRNMDCTVILAKITTGRRNVKAHPNRGSRLEARG